METKTLLTKSFSFIKVTIFLLVCTNLLMPRIIAQMEYTPFPKGNITWQSKGFGCYSDTLYHFTLSIDTASIAIDNKNYNKIFINDIFSQKYVGGIREEDKKIYLYHLGEHLIYDFGLEIGDTLLINNIFVNIRVEHFGNVNVLITNSDFHYIQFIYIVIDKSIITLENGEERNTLIVDRYICNFHDAPDIVYTYFDATYEWVEGLGTIGGQGFFTHLDFEHKYFYTPVYLECICQNNSKLFGTNSYCCQNVHINENIQQPIKIYPNPTTGELIINNEQLIINNIEVFDIYGRKLLSHHLITSSSNHLITSSSHHLINISHLPAGLYLVKITTEAGVVVKKVVKQ